MSNTESLATIAEPPKNNGKAPTNYDRVIESRPSDPASASSPPIESPRVFDWPIPLLRDKRKNPIRRRFPYIEPLVSLDKESLIATAEAFSKSVDEGARLLPLLKAKNAIAADENVQTAKREIQGRIDRRNAEIDHEINELGAKLQAAIDGELVSRAEAVAHLETLPLAFRPDDPALDFAMHEPTTLVEIAGQHEALAPEEEIGWWDRIGYKLFSSIGGGLIFGLSLGLLSDQIEMASFREQWPAFVVFGILGIMVLTIVGGALFKPARFVGSWIYHRGLRVPWLSAVNFVCMLLMLVGFILVVGRVESRVEQLGIFKAYSDNDRLTNMTLSQADLLLVSLMLVVPVIGIYFFGGLAEGHRSANLTFLRHELKKLRNEIRAGAPFAKAAVSHQKLRHAMEIRSSLEGDIESLKGQIRKELNEEELYRLEDMERDAAAYSWAVERWMVALANGKRPAKAARPKSVGRPAGFWARLFDRLFGRA